MGYSIYAYFDISQKEIGEIYKKELVNIKSDLKCNYSNKNEENIIEYFKYKYLIDEDRSRFNINYYLTDYKKKHKIYSYYQINFIRDYELLNSEENKKMLEKKIGKKYPYCLDFFYHWIESNEDAAKIASELELFYPDKCDLMDFAKWLRFTSKYCSFYKFNC